VYVKLLYRLMPTQHTHMLDSLSCFMKNYVDLNILLQTTSLKPPYGSCGTQSLHHYNSSTEVYTAAKCREECEMDSLWDACGCILYYMPGNETLRV